MSSLRDNKITIRVHKQTDDHMRLEGNDGLRVRKYTWYFSIQSNYIDIPVQFLCMLDLYRFLFNLEKKHRDYFSNPFALYVYSIKKGERLCNK